jgi:hypothetical protein
MFNASMPVEVPSTIILYLATPRKPIRNALGKVVDRVIVSEKSPVIYNKGT